MEGNYYYYYFQRGFYQNKINLDICGYLLIIIWVERIIIYQFILAQTYYNYLMKYFEIEKSLRISYT